MSDIVLHHYAGGMTTGISTARASVAILREDPEVGRVVCHFPRVGFRVLRG
jgi:hypothetical protein